MCCLAAALSAIVSGCGDSASAVPTPRATVAPSVAPTDAASAPPEVRVKGRPRPPLTSGPVTGSAYQVVAVKGLLVAGMESNGVLVSSDQGQSWHAMNTGLPPDPGVPALAVAPGSGRLFAVVSGAVYGAAPRLPLTWSAWGLALPRGSNPEAIAYWPPSHAVLVGDGGGAVYVASRADGAWTSADSGLPVGLQAVTTLLVHAGTIYAGLTNGLAVSGDGEHWRLDPAFGAHQVSALAILPAGGLAAALDQGGLAVRPRAGGAWAFTAPSGLGVPAGARVLSVAYDAAGGTLLLGTLADGLRRLAGLSPPARLLRGVAAGNPINGLLPIERWLYAATNAGIVRIALPAER